MIRAEGLRLMIIRSGSGISIEPKGCTLHIPRANQQNWIGKVKIDMGKQSNKVEKRRRRTRYNKRKKEQAKVKKVRTKKG
ncbi:MAG: hypothetical protein FJ405_03445 [Verrucomicrobia bacterium]|nr:hypothetical protein [Verrucomicrobiota bacterium]